MPLADCIRGHSLIMHPERRRALSIAVGLSVAVVVIYWQTHAHGFVEFDDPGYVSDNPFVRRGLTWEGVRWAFTTGKLGNWNPLTWLSHMLDVQLFGVAPGAHHLMAAAFHLANTLLLFAVLTRMTGALWPSAVVAALFGVHPLHVESVAWISERKDVLSTLCWFALLWSYVRYVETRAAHWYALVLVWFGLGLMAKPMLVTTPFLLLLLDLWPLGRVAAFPDRAARGDARQGAPPGAARSPRRAPARVGVLLLEKVPLLLLTVAFSALAYLMQMRSGAVPVGDKLSIGLRVANALVAYVRYLGMALWPADLAVLYPFDTALPAWQPIAAGLALLLASAVVVRVARRLPYVLVGWLWYLGTLVPVIGLVQIGSQGFADRYTYVPLIGIFIIIAWGGRDLVARWALPVPLVAGVGSALLAAYAAAAWVQVGRWCDGVTLLTHTVAVTRDNCVARNNLGVALAGRGEIDAALEQFREAVRIKPDYADPYNNIGLAFWRRGDIAAAAEQYRRALQYDPGSPETQSNLGLALSRLGQRDAGIAHLQEALRLDPSFAGAYVNLGNALRDSGRTDEAIAQYEQALRIKPDYADPYTNLGAIAAQAGRRDEALQRFHTALRFDPNSVDAHDNLGLLLSQSGQSDAAIEEWRAGLRAEPDDTGVRVHLADALRLADRAEEAITEYEAALQRDATLVEARYHLALLLTQGGRTDEAIAQFEEVLRRRDDYPDAHNDLGVALVQSGRVGEAVPHFQRALALQPDYADAQYNLGVAQAMLQDANRLAPSGQAAH